LKAIRDLTKTINARQSELDRITADIARCDAATDAHEAALAAVTAARQRRDAEAADAFLAKRDPDPVFNAELDRAEQQTESLRASGEAARGALAVIEQRCEELKAEIAAARVELTALALEDVAQRRAKARAAFNAAVDALREPLEEMCALDGVTRTLTGNYNPYTPSAMLLDALNGEGLRVWTERGLQGPAWMGSINQRSTEKYQALAGELRAAGLQL
jgi:chromosome segregation ATPase